jgi:hypothetical protein
VTSRTGTAIVLVALFGGPAEAAPRAGGGTTGSTVAWTVAGAGVGFGLGLWTGLTAFDDAVDSNRKVWTTAVACAAAGGGLAYLVQRTRHRPHPAAPSMTGEELRVLTEFGSRRLDGASTTLLNLKARPERVAPPTRKWRNWQTR